MPGPNIVTGAMYVCPTGGPLQFVAIPKGTLMSVKGMPQGDFSDMIPMVNLVPMVPFCMALSKPPVMIPCIPLLQSIAGTPVMRNTGPTRTQGDTNVCALGGGSVSCAMTPAVTTVQAD